MTIHDESGEEEEEEGVRCPFCQTGIDEISCEHVLAFIDDSEGAICGGYVYEHNYESAFTEEITKVFRERLISGETSKWKNDFLNILWTALIDLNEVESPEDDFSLPSAEFSELVVELLEEAGGVFHFGGFVVGAGSRCGEARVRIMYDENPKKICDLAAKFLTKWLAKKPANH